MESQQPTAAVVLIERARQERRNGARAAALAAFEAAAVADPQNDGIKVEVAAELRALERIADAREVLDGVLTRAPRMTTALIEVGHLCRRQNDHRGALAAFEGAAANHPEHTGMQLEVVRGLRMLGRLDEAEALLARALAGHPRDLGGLIERGHLRRRQGDHAGALAAFEAAATIDDGHAGIKLEIAESLRALGRDDEAEAFLRRLLFANPDNAAALVALARLLADGERAEEAEALLDGTPPALLDNGGVAIVRVHVARKRGDDDATLRHLARAVSIEPANFDLALDLAAERRRRGDLEEAQRVAAGVLDKLPDHPRAWLETGYIRRAANDREGATAAFSAALARQPAMAQALVELANEAWTAGRPDEARDFFERALAQEPDHLAALLTSAEHCLRSDDPEGALSRVDHAIAAHPRQMGPLLFGARAAAAIPDRARAIAFLDEAHTRFDDRPEILASRIHVLRALGEHAAAISVSAAAGATVTHEAAWAEIVALRIFAGDFDGAGALLDALPDRLRETPRAYFFRGQLAEAKRDYPAAIGAYAEALSRDPSNGDGHGEMARACLLRLDVSAASAHLRLSLLHNAAGGFARGQSLNPSQHHVGQLLDEFSLDARSLERLREIDGLPTKAQLAPLRALVRGSPDSTAAAIALVLAIRRAGGFSPGLESTAIPRRVVQFWDNAEPPSDIQALMASWHDETGVWEHRIFDEPGAEAFLRQHFERDVALAFRRAHHAAQRSDIFRLAYLAHSGGLYADADDRRVAPFAALVPADARLVAYLENYGTIGNNFLAASPRHPAIVRALELAVAAVNRGDHDIVWLSTGPGLVTRALAHFVAGASSDEGAGLIVRELFEMRRLVDIHCPARYKATTQHWSRAAFGPVGARANRALENAAPAFALRPAP